MVIFNTCSNFMFQLELLQMGVYLVNHRNYFLKKNREILFLTLYLQFCKFLKVFAEFPELDSQFIRKKAKPRRNEASPQPVRGKRRRQGPAPLLGAAPSPTRARGPRGPLVETPGAQRPVCLAADAHRQLLLL